MVEEDLLGHVATHGEPDEDGRGCADVVEDGEDVVDQVLDTERAGRGTGPAVAAQVDGDDAMPIGKWADLSGPGAMVDAGAVQEDDDGRVLRASDPVVQRRSEPFEHVERAVVDTAGGVVDL